MNPPQLPVLRTALRVLAFQATREELLRLDRRHLAFGLCCTGIVGIGRSWDDPHASLLRHSGIGSLVYVFVLSGLLLLLLRPLRVPDLRYSSVLTCVCLASPPGILYAIPVERFCDLPTATGINLGFLVVVAAWRVALLAFYLSRLARLRWYAVAITTLCLLVIILAPLAVVGMSSRILQDMAGLRRPLTSEDAANDALLALGGIAILAFVPVLLVYQFLVINAARRD